MRELEEIKIVTEVFDQAEVKKTLQLLGRRPIKRGHRVFEIAVTPEGVTIVQVETEKEVIIAPSTTVKGKLAGFKKQKVIGKKDCYYISALNKKNALAKLFKNRL